MSRIQDNACVDGRRLKVRRQGDNLSTARNYPTMTPRFAPTHQSDPETWVDAHADYLFRFAIVRIADTAAAEELVQETFVAALAARREFRGESTERTWLTGILRHKIADFLRQKYRHHAQPLDADNRAAKEEFFDAGGNWKTRSPTWGRPPQEHLEGKQLLQRILTCLEQLPQRQADAFRLREFDGADAETICKVLRIQPTHYWVLLHRARLGLQRCLGPAW